MYESYKQSLFCFKFVYKILDNFFSYNHTYVYYFVRLYFYNSNMYGKVYNTLLK